MKAYPFSNSVHCWLDKVEAGITDALGGDSDMAEAVSGHFEGVHGKRLRPALAILAAGALGDITDDALGLAVGIELVHAATLVHDDVVDGAPTRRGVATPNAKWGSDYAILIGDFVFSRAFSVLAGLRNADIIGALSRAVSRMCEGEWDQLRSRFGPGPTVEGYRVTISGKTASFMGCCCECGALLSGAAPDAAKALYDFGHSLGMAFQIVDDLLDYRGDPQRMGKPVAEDVACGVYTLPLIVAIERDESGELGELLISAVEDAEARADLVRAVVGSGAIEASMEIARTYVAEAVESLRYLPESESKRMLSDLAAFVCDRDY